MLTVAVVMKLTMILRKVGPYEDVEGSQVVSANALSHPWTVVVKSLNADVAVHAVLSLPILQQSADMAETIFFLHSLAWDALGAGAIPGLEKPTFREGQNKRNPLKRGTVFCRIGNTWRSWCRGRSQPKHCKGRGAVKNRGSI